MAIELLKTLIAISETGSFGDAAERVCVSQAAVSQRMKRLEQELNVVLFNRDGRSPDLNQLGKALVPKARQVIQTHDEMIASVKGEDYLTGEIIIGAVPSAISELVPQSIKELIKAYPDVWIRLVPGLTTDLFAQVERGALDGAILSEPDLLGLHLKWQPFVREPLVLIASKEVEYGDPLHLLKTRPYIRMTRRAPTGQLAEEWLGEMNLHVRDSMELESLESISRMVAHDLGVSIIPKTCVPDPLYTSLKFISLEPSAKYRTLGILSRFDSSKFRLVDSLLDELEKTVTRASENHV